MSFTFDSVIPEITKAPNAVLDYGHDWSSWLSTDEAILKAEWAVSPSGGDGGIVVGTSIISDGLAVAWLSGGLVGQSYLLTCAITTTAGRVDSRSFRVNVAVR